MIWLNQLKNVPMAMLVGIFLGIAFMCLLGSQLDAELKRYGTFLLTAFVTLTASGVALATTIWNSEAQRERKLIAAKASLPLALSQLVKVARSGFFASISDEEYLKNPDNAEIVATSLTISDETFGTLKECIEHSDKVSAQWLANIIAHYQVYRSRLVGGIQDGSIQKTDAFRADHAAEWIFWQAIVCHMFDFARGTNLSPDQMNNDVILDGFRFEIAGLPIQKRIIKRLQLLEEHHHPLNSASVRFRAD